MNKLQKNKWEGLKFHSPLLLVLLGFIVYKFNVLGLPYHWDELGVYSRAALVMHDKDLGMLPSVTTSDVVRGHPTLFFYVYKLFFQLFGTSVYVGHGLSLGISVCFLASVYWISYSLNFYDRAEQNRRLALIATVFLIFQPIFSVQSTMVLPEVFLGVWMLWSIYAFFKEKYILYSICGALAMLTKETALILPAMAVLYGFWEWWSKKPINYKRVVLGILSPSLVFVIFFSLQRYFSGYFFYPYHIELIDWSIGSVAAKLYLYLAWLFQFQGRFIVLILLIYLFVKRKELNKEVLHPFSVLTLCVFIPSLGFFTLNYFMARYLIFLLPFVAIFFAYAWILMYQNWKKWAILFALAIIGSGIINHFSFMHFHFDVDADHSYLEIVEMQKKAIDYTLNLRKGEETIGCQFPLVNCFQDHRQGYSPISIPFEDLSTEVDSSVHYLDMQVFFSPWDTLPNRNLEILNKGFSLIERWDGKNVQIVLYSRKY